VLKFFKIIVVIEIFFVIISCERDYLFRGGVDGLYFSQDTVLFDTIFTTIGSATHHFKAYNPYESDMTIETIKLAGGDESMFKININGFPGNIQNDIPLNGRDSIFIFVEVTIDPLQTNASFFTEDSILFYTKDRVQSVILKANMQEVIVLQGHIIKEDVKFTKEKPYLIYDSLTVEESRILTIESGTHLHF
jgi:hypothetical protein